MKVRKSFEVGSSVVWRNKFRRTDMWFKVTIDEKYLVWQSSLFKVLSTLFCLPQPFLLYSSPFCFYIFTFT
jgi:hypothetical protein